MRGRTWPKAALRRGCAPPGSVQTQTNPRDIDVALSGQRLGNYWKYRVGDWRIICDIQDQKILVRVLRIGNRREVDR